MVGSITDRNREPSQLMHLALCEDWKQGRQHFISSHGHEELTDHKDHVSEEKKACS